MKDFFKLLLIFYISIFSCSFEYTIIEWKDGIVPYYFSGSFADEDVEIVLQAMRRWESAAGVEFVEVTPRSYAYKIRRIPGSNLWSSSVGENNVLCYLNYGSPPDSYGHVLHELGHGLGLMHEHQRPDRDSYVTINWYNIVPGFEYYFDIVDNPLYVEEDLSYDYSSIMHYSETGFGIDGSITIDPAVPGSNIGQRNDISLLDEEKVRAIYGPPREITN